MSSSPSRFPPADDPGTTPPRITRCPTCSASGENARNLVVCIDGTANKFGQDVDNTNVVRLLKAVDCENEDPQFKQYVYYSSGIGTRPGIAPLSMGVQRTISDKLDMAIAWNVKKTVKEAYAWLVGKYQKGDQIYLFGFSRGAYQVRMLAAMIYEVGLLKTHNEKQIETAYDRFKSTLTHKPNAHGMAQEFKGTFSRENARVHFIGVWDTVSSVGLWRRDVHLSASSPAAHACHIRHALALDECRVKFMPEYFLGMNSPDFHNAAKDNQLGSGGMGARGLTPEATINNPNVPTSEGTRNTSSDDIVPEDRDNTAAERAQPAAANMIPSTQSGISQYTNGKNPDIKEVWFAGSHPDVGGMHRLRKCDHAGDVSLMWMRHEATTSGLLLKHDPVDWTARNLDSGTSNSMSFFWKLIEILPIRHQVSFSGPGENARRLHLCKPRRIIPGQKIHASVQFANTYVPKATFGNGFGNPLETVGLIPSREDNVWEKVAIDDGTYAALLNNFEGTKETTPFYLHRLLFLLRSAGGQWPAMAASKQQEMLTGLISTRSGLVKLAAIAAYSEAMDSSSGLEDTIQEDVLLEAREFLAGVIKLSQPNWPRAVALLRPLAKHKVLRDSILTAEVIDRFVQVLDHVISVPGEHFVHVMDALSSLVELHPDSITGKLLQPPSGASRSRISLMLDTIDPYHFTAVLGVVVATGKDPSPSDKLSGVNDDFRGHFPDQGIPDIFIEQLRYKESALLAAYALTKCLAHEISSTRIKEDPRLAERIFNMIKMDYFDEVMGMTEGFTILEDLLKCDDLRHKILECGIAKLLVDKLAAGKPAEKHMTLIYLNIFRIHGEDLLTLKLVERGLSYLETNQWKTQKAGVTILCFLVQTRFGVEALTQARAIPRVVKMLPIDVPDGTQSKLPSALFGPACVLHFMATHETLREEIRQTPEYWTLSYLYRSGDFLDAKDTPLWQVKTPTRDDVLDKIGQTIQSLDDRNVKGSMDAGFVLPHICHSDRIANIVRYGVMGVIVGPPVIAGAGAVVTIGAITLAPVVISRKVTKWFRRRQCLRRQKAIMDSIGKDSRSAPGNANT